MLFKNDDIFNYAFINKLKYLLNQLHHGQFSYEESDIMGKNPKYNFEMIRNMLLFGREA